MGLADLERTLKSHWEGVKRTPTRSRNPLKELAEMGLMEKEKLRI